MYAKTRLRTRKVANSIPAGTTHGCGRAGRDISRPRQRNYPVPSRVVVPVLGYVTGKTLCRRGRGWAGVTLVATDVPWSSGTGPEVRGAAADLLRVAAGRAASLDHVAGRGVDLFVERIGL